VNAFSDLKMKTFGEIEAALAKEERAVSIEFEGVTFGYTDSDILLKNFTKKFEAGKVYGISTPSGSGKSTIFN
jgi:ABC-type multidrug transport system fused ATPase/permease subunit